MTDYTVILANGRFPSHPIPLKYLADATRIVCCDGAVDKLLAHGLQPYAVVGDMDSVSRKCRDNFANISYKVDEQNTNDLTKAVNFCVEKKIKNLVILGATGLREDHAIGNISLLIEYLQLANVIMITNHGTFRAINSDTIFDSFPGQQLSIFCIDPSTTIKSENLRYSLNDVKFKNWWNGTLNESISENFRLFPHDSIPIIVFLEHKL